MASLLCLLALIKHGASRDISAQLAAANGNTTTLKTQIAPGYVDGAQTRGTSDIVWSCLLTLTACIYSAIHLDVPPPNKGKWWLLNRKVLAAAVALLGPEFVLHSALTQFLMARGVKRKVNTMRGQNWKDNSKPKLVDLQYGFYVTMGGFVYVLDDLTDHPSCSRMVLTPSGVIALARQGHFVDIDQRTIEDKSKANILTKSLICIQVSWMVIQCIARAAADYPLTLLEVHSMVHVVCAICMYTLWWNKSFDVIEPTLISPSEFNQYSGMLALMLLKHEALYGLPSALEHFRFTTDSAKLNAFNDRAMERDRPCRTASNQSLAVQSLRSTENVKQSDEVSFPPPVRYFPCGMGLLLAKGHSRHRNAWFDGGGKERKLLELSAAAIESMLAVMSPEDREENVRELEIDLRSFLDTFRFTNGLRISAVDKFLFNDDDVMTQVLPGARILDEGILDYYALILSFATLYGGVHLAAWSFDFPTPAEAILWKVVCFLVILIPYLFLVFDWISVSDKMRTSLLWRLGAYGIGLVFFSSKMFLIIESFISLRHVPIGVYAAVPWVQNIPHV